jgi:hypothetical protein
MSGILCRDHEPVITAVIPVTPVIFLSFSTSGEICQYWRGDMNTTIVLALVIAGGAVFLLQRFVVRSLARKGEGAAENSR